MKRICLTFPGTHSNDEIVYLLTSFKESHPIEYKTWVEIERNFDEESDPLAPIQNSVFNFLMTNTEWEGNSSLNRAWVDMRKAVLSSL